MNLQFSPPKKFAISVNIPPIYRGAKLRPIRPPHGHLKSKYGSTTPTTPQSVTARTPVRASAGGGIL